MGGSVDRREYPWVGVLTGRSRFNFSGAVRVLVVVVVVGNEQTTSQVQLIESTVSGDSLYPRISLRRH